ncbi:MAG: J domain-containing protein [Candidatus Marinimicrobia bacterium]|nr:J domain-containing protein [Candidatus Neomarinimicrobiota bacterium]
MQDPYITLGIRENVGDAEVQAAYHRRLRQFPPEDCPQEFAAISEAYELLRTELDRVTFALTGACPDPARLTELVRPPADGQPTADPRVWLRNAQRHWLTRSKS